MMRKLFLGTASVLALGIGGAAVDFAANAGPGTSHHWLDVGNLSKDDIRWAQVELHYNGLYNGSLDGVVGLETTRALLTFQKTNGLQQTARLDQQTADALVGDTGVGEGSSRPHKNKRFASTRKINTSHN